jgi:hypothetical protein
MAILKYENLLKELDKYPNLKGAVEHFYDNNGKPEHEGCLPNLIVWIRKVLDIAGEDAAKFFEMSEETAEDFYSWGHNSRWANTFWCFLERHFNWCIGLCIELAERYGDYDIEKYMNETKEA